MDQHPIPQNVTGFEFKLIGDMTVKQFAYLASFCVFGYLTYLLPLHFLIRWPIIVTFVVFGIALAFVPLGGRPMDRMILNFIKALFANNQFIYKEGYVPDYATDEPQAERPQTAQVPQESIIESYTVPIQPPPPPPPPAQPVQSEIPTISVPVPAKRAAPVKTEVSKEEPKPGQVDSSEKKTQSPLEIPVPSIPNVMERSTPIDMLPPNPIDPTFAQNSQSGLTKDTPNIITGVVQDEKGDALPGIIIEVKDQTGIAVRAFKTNKLGQFAAATPLGNGTYTIEVEDPLHRFPFEAMTLTLDGKILQSMEIKPKDSREELRRSLFSTTA